MSNVSEQISELSAELLLKAIGALSEVAYHGVTLVDDVARNWLIKLINESKSEDRAAKKLSKAVEDGENPLQITVFKKDLEIMETWLKKQHVGYVAVDFPNPDVADEEKKSMIMFLDKDAEKVALAAALLQKEKGYVNELPPRAFLLLNKRKDISAVDNLDVYELEVFRHVAKELGLVYAAMLNEKVNPSEPDSYKILCSKNDVEKLAAVMQRVSWSMTGEYKEGIKEKVKERYSIKKEIQDLIKNGVKEGTITLADKEGVEKAVENAKYIVNAKVPSQFVKLTAKGAFVYKNNEKSELISAGDPEYTKKLDDVLGDYLDAVVIDAKEWELENCNHSNRRKGTVKQKLSIFPPKHNAEKETEELRKAHKKHAKDHDELDESAWLFHKFDSEKAYSEVVEINYNDTSPLEETVSVHYGAAVEYSEKYKYFDAVNDKKTIDNIILDAKEKSMGNYTYEKTEEKEI